MSISPTRFIVRSLFNSSRVFSGCSACFGGGILKPSIYFFRERN